MERRSLWRDVMGDAVLCTAPCRGIIPLKWCMGGAQGCFYGVYEEIFRFGENGREM